MQPMLADQRASRPAGTFEFRCVDRPSSQVMDSPTADLDHQQGTPATGDQIQFAPAADPIAGG